MPHHIEEVGMAAAFWAGYGLRIPGQSQPDGRPHVPKDVALSG